MRTKTFGISRAVSVLLALITAFVAAFSCLSVSAKAFDATSVRQGVVPVVFCLKNAALVYADPNTGKAVKTSSLGAECLLSSGSGFFVGKTGENPQYIVTNHHVVEDYVDAGEGGKCQIYAGKSQGYYVFFTGSSCEMRIYYSENDYDVAYVDCHGDVSKVDLAVLKLRNPTDKRQSLKIGTVSEDNVGDTVYTVGYPGNADNDFTSASKFGVNDSSVHKGSLVRIVMNEKGVERISVDATIQHGNSGGPLVNENGYVIGVNTNVESNSPYSEQIEADYYSLSANTLMDFLNKNSIPYEKASGSSGSSNIPDTSITTDTSNTTVTPPPTTHNDTNNTNSSNSTGGIIAIVAAVVVVGAVVVVVMMKKGKQPAAPAQSAAPSAPAPVQASAPQSSSNAMLICEKGTLAGRTFPIGNGVVIGRDANRCGVCFPVDTKGVSGAHCSIRKTANGFEIVDLASSYGTTLGSGQKLTPNVAVFIPSGTYFTVGSADQLFQIKY